MLVVPKMFLAYEFPDFPILGFDRKEIHVFCGFGMSEDLPMLKIAASHRYKDYQCSVLNGLTDVDYILITNAGAIVLPRARILRYPSMRLCPPCFATIATIVASATVLLMEP